MQIATSTIYVDVGNVAYPELVCVCQADSADQIFPLMEAMV